MNQSIEDASRKQIMEDANAAGFEIRFTDGVVPDVYVDFEKITKQLIKFAQLREARQSSQSEPIATIRKTIPNDRDGGFLSVEDICALKALPEGTKLSAAPQQVSQSEPVGNVHESYLAANEKGMYVNTFFTENKLAKATNLYLSAPQQAIPSGWKLVPIEPTREMLVAGATNYDGKEPHQTYQYSEVGQIYRDMLSAAPTAPRESDK
jgi:hypothetical protein